MYLAAHPNQVLKQIFMVWDQTGTHTVDRVTTGTGWMFNNDDTHAVKCTTEAAC